MRVVVDRRVEFYYRKAFYLFPVRSKIFIDGNRLCVEILGRKTTGVSKYLSEKPDATAAVAHKIGLPITGYGSALCKKYQAVADYLKRNPTLDFLHFDHATSNDLALCTFFKSADLMQTDNFISDMQKELPFLTNIYRRPVIHLKEADTILPVDAVKRVNHGTVRHLSTRAENWESVKNGTIVPRKLLTKVYEDDYGIYENIVLRDLTDELLSFLQKRIYFLSETLNTLNETVRLDAFTRINHETYYLAIGKLYVGFFKTENTAEVMATLKSAKQLYGRISQYKSRPVYTKNAGARPISGAVKRTNILGMHKDYKHVYALAGQFRKRITESQESGNYLLQMKSQTNYELFCQMLVLFAASTFNMRCPPDTTVFEDGKANAYFEYKDWSLVISVKSIPALDINAIFFSAAHKDKTENCLFIPMSYYIPDDKKRHYEHILERLVQCGCNYDKYAFFEPFDFEHHSLNNYSVKYTAGGKDFFYAVLPISISEINSFRRVQKLLFECMVKSDPVHQFCAFCGEETQKEQGNKYLCKKCRTAVRIVPCGGCGNEFKATYVDIKKKPRKKRKEDEKEAEKEEEYVKNLPDFYRQEKQYFFRNIVNIREGNFICPHCGAEHKI